MNEVVKSVLKIAIAPIDISFGDVKINLSTVSDIIEALEQNVDILVLPELFSTGFRKSPEIMASLAETIEGDTITTLKELSLRNNLAICGSFVCSHKGKILNRAFFLSPDGKEHYYDKRHLFTMGGEQNIFSSGKCMPEIIEFKGWKIMTAVCYDLRFPAWLRNSALKYDLLIIPANWAHSRAYAWKHLLIARAIENQAYVIGCNRGGQDEYGEYPFEDTLAFDNWGKDIAIRSDDGVIYCSLDRDKLNLDRERFSPWRDADTFTFEDFSEDSE